MVSEKEMFDLRSIIIKTEQKIKEYEKQIQFLQGQLVNEKNENN